MCRLPCTAKARRLLFGYASPLDEGAGEPTDSNRGQNAYRCRLPISTLMFIVRRRTHTHSPRPCLDWTAGPWVLSTNSMAFLVHRRLGVAFRILELGWLNLMNKINQFLFCRANDFYAVHYWGDDGDAQTSSIWHPPTSSNMRRYIFIKRIVSLKKELPMCFLSKWFFSNFLVHCMVFNQGWAVPRKAKADENGKLDCIDVSLTLLRCFLIRWLFQ